MAKSNNAWLSQEERLIILCITLSAYCNQSWFIYCKVNVPENLLKTLRFTCREPNFQKGVALGWHTLYANVSRALQLSSLHESYGPG